MARRTRRGFTRFLKSLSVVLGIVMIWRGIWHVMDWMDIVLFQGDTRWTAVGGIVLGLLILYLPDGDVKELDKL